MKAVELYSLFRSDVVDINDPPLWKDEEIFAYLDDAQMMLCRLTLGLGDMSTPSVCEVPVVAGEAFSDLHSSILTVRYAQLASSGRELELYNLVAGRMVSSSHDYGSRSISLISATAGPVTGAVLGIEPDRVRWVQVPVADDMVQLAVYRLPITPITDGDSELEVHRRHRMALLQWMEHLAYLKQDSETYDRARSDEKGKNFYEYCALVKREQERAKHKPREVEYGGL